LFELHADHTEEVIKFLTIITPKYSVLGIEYNKNKEEIYIIV